MSAAKDKVIARELILNACRAYATNESAYTNGEVKQAIRSLLLRVEDLIDGRERDHAEIERLREAAVNAVNGKDHAYREVWERLISHGLLSFIGGDGSGLSRALAFIDHLAARASSPAPAPVVPTAAEAEAGWLRDKIAYYAAYPDTRCTFGGESCITIKQLAKAVRRKKEGT